MQPDGQHNIAQWPTRWAARRPHAIALIEGSERLSWFEFEARIARTAGALQEAGLGFGDRVAVLLQNRSTCLEILLGAARLGAVTLPLNLRLTPMEIAYQLDDCRPTLLLHEQGLSDLVAQAGSQSSHPLRLISVGGEPDDFSALRASAIPRSKSTPVKPDDPVLLLYTSGTTGQPKGAVLPHRKTLYNSLNATLDFGIRDTDRVLIVAPLFHSLGLQILSLPALYAGACLVIQSGFDPERVWDTVQRERITYFGAVPSMYQRLHDELERPNAPAWDTSSLRFLFTAGSAISTHLVEAFHQKGLALVQGYGQTETSTLCCLQPSDALRKAGTVGQPVFHAEIRVIDPQTRAFTSADWRDADPGTTGEIVVRGPTTMLGYWEKPAETAETMIDGWLCTGDLAQVDEEGFFTLVGRSREMFISGGENVYPAEIEAACREHPNIREIAVVSDPDDKWGEVGRAHIVLESGTQLEPSSFKRWARERLAAYKIPQTLVFESDLPRTASGKVQKHLLKN